jgi:hypothetical protein
MLKNESAWNVTKHVPLHPSHLLDSDGIFTLSNGLRMEKISRSTRNVKQAKKMLTGQSVQADVAEAVQVMWQNPYSDVEKFMW